MFKIKMRLHLSSPINCWRLNAFKYNEKINFTKGPSTKDVRQMGEGVVLKFRTFPDGGRGWFCENRNSKISQSSLTLKLEIIIDRDSNMRAFTYDVCSNLGVSK